MARQYAKIHGLKAHEVMSRHVSSVRDDVRLRRCSKAIARKQSVVMVPVVRDGALAGIISRSDLVRALSERRQTNLKIRRRDLAGRKRGKICNQTGLNSGYFKMALPKPGVWCRRLIKYNALLVLIDVAEGGARVEDHLRVGMPPIGG